jgi:hypothetical protein
MQMLTALFCLLIQHKLMPRRDLYHFGTAYHYNVNGTVFIVSFILEDETFVKSDLYRVVIIKDCIVVLVVNAYYSDKMPTSKDGTVFVVNYLDKYNKADVAN